MKLVSSHVLGLAIADRSIAVAEISGRGDRAVVKRAATFAFPDDVALDKPQIVGAALAMFLKQQGFTASHCVAGIPAKWLVAVEKEVPPAGREQFKTMLRIQAERLPLSEAGELVFDYAGQYQPHTAGKVLVVAMLKRQLERVEQIVESAHLTLLAVTPSSLALASASSGRGGDAPILSLSRHSAEVIWQEQGKPRMLRHFGVTASNGHGMPMMGPLGTELRRALSMTSVASSSGNELQLWDGIGLEDSQVAELSDRLGLKLQPNDGVNALNLSSEAGAEENPARFAPALALARTGTDRVLLPFDFSRSRLAPPPVRKFGRKSVYATVIGALVLISIGALLVDVQLKKNALYQVQQDRAERKDLRDKAQEIKDRVDFSAGYFTKRTAVLECLLQVTLAFGQEDPIFVTEFKIEEDRETHQAGRVKGSLEGRASDWNWAKDLADQLRKNPAFSGVTGPTVTGAGGGGGGAGRQVGNQAATFAITFFFDVDRIPQ